MKIFTIVLFVLTSAHLCLAQPHYLNESDIKKFKIKKIDRRICKLPQI